MTVTYKAEGSGTQQAAALFRKSEMRAERTIGVVRILVSLMLAVSLLLAAIEAAPRRPDRSLWP